MSLQACKEINEYRSKEKILLLFMPFWVPFIPPLGISCLKGFLSRHGYDIKTVDVNWEMDFWKTSYVYTGLLNKSTMLNGKENPYGETNVVFRNHLMAFINRSNEADYMKFLKDMIAKHTLVDIDEESLYQLNEIIKGFYMQLEAYLQELIEKEKPSVVGMSVYSGTLAASLFGFRYIKEKFPHIMTVMGGGVFTGQLALGWQDFEKFVEKTTYIDKIIVGEGEKLFLKLLQNQLPENQKVYTLSDIKGETIELSEAPLPDFGDFKVEKYPQMVSYASRSCPFQCSFCSETVMWGNYRKKDAKQIADEMICLLDKYKNRLFLLGDSLLNPVISELSYEFIDRGVEIYWDGYIRADKHVCSRENALLWRKGGFYRGRLGVESGSRKVLELMDKRITPEQIKEAVISLASAGIKTSTYWVIGHPGEEEEDFLDTLRVIEELKDYLYEVKCNSFNYYLSGQVNSDKWGRQYGISPLYTENGHELLMSQTWILNSTPTREETFDRVRRFGEHRKKLGIPSPSTLKEIHEADIRWKNLHQNAVPSTEEIKNMK